MHRRIIFLLLWRRTQAPIHRNRPILDLTACKSRPDALDTAVEGYRTRKTRKAERYERWEMLRGMCVRVCCCHLVVEGFDKCEEENIDVCNHFKLDAKCRSLRKQDEAIVGTNTHVVVILSKYCKKYSFLQTERGKFTSR